MSNTTGKGGFQDRKHQINRKGRPKSFDAMRKLAQSMAHEVVSTKKGDMTLVQKILMEMANDPRQRAEFLEIAFGKVPNTIEVSGKNGADIPVRVIDYRNGLTEITTRSDEDSD